MRRRLTLKGALPVADRCKYPEAFKMPACSHALEDLFQRSGFTWQRSFDGLWTQKRSFYWNPIPSLSKSRRSINGYPQRGASSGTQS